PIGFGGVFFFYNREAVLYRGVKYVFLGFVGFIVVVLSKLFVLRVSGMVGRVWVLFVFIAFMVRRKN
ncbi:hypothetical protein ACVGV4_21350, partial [Enterobacter hormaechei]